MTYILVGFVRLYQIVLSPLLPNACRYQPTCSRYAIETLQKHGPFRGFYLATRRLMSCHPWGGHGHDPIP
ncbi:MAG TPA: membrane protein insertion efficiency factor YidD [Bacteroidia bacterium]|nr:membrane protein insertion efficiency factor YidD [Bacteroidia bacterium]